MALDAFPTSPPARVLCGSGPTLRSGTETPTAVSNGRSWRRARSRMIPAPMAATGACPDWFRPAVVGRTGER
jgi:hypothetical protein